MKGPACGPVLLDIVKGFAAEQGWHLTIDFFASACNHVTERYMSWTADPTCVLVDAFTARSWNVSLRPWCQRSHRETGFFFAPYGLEDKVVRRARSDGVQAIFLVPVNRRAPFFQALQQHAAASLEVAADRDGIFRNTQGRHMAKHMLFAADLGGSDRVTPWCVQGLGRRAPGRILRPVEAVSTGWAPESTRRLTGGSGLARAYCTRSVGTTCRES